MSQSTSTDIKLDTLPKVSIIVRTKNEEKWIGHCLGAIFEQEYSNFEVILVDNRSTDKSVAKAQKWPIILVDIADFKPGKALNLGIESSSGDIIVCISGHCIPTDPYWLTNLVTPLADHSIGGVYGRQEPLVLTSELDRRDLYLIFGQDSRVQVKDSFFHNANSAFRREVWLSHPFDEEISNIEDRLWGKEILAQGFRIRYQASASVYHYHGIHHEAQKERAKRIVEIMELMEGSPACLSSISGGHKNIAIVASREDHANPIIAKLFKKVLQQLKASPYLSAIVVSTTDPTAIQIAKEYACFIHLREADEENAESKNTGIQSVYRDALIAYEDKVGIPDSVTFASETYPLRHDDTFNRLFRVYIESGANSVISGWEEKRPTFILDNHNESTLNKNLLPSRSVENQIAICSVGLGCVVNPALVRSQSILAENILVVPVQNQQEMIELNYNDNILKFKQSIEELLP